jgi:membrane protein implicated in regulation of membrane protease activity
MAIIATLIGGVTGFFSFLCALVVFDFSFLQALALYVGVGTSLTLSLILAALSWRSVASLSRQRPGLDRDPMPAHAGSMTPEQ